MSCNYKRLGASRRYPYLRVTGSGLLCFIIILSVRVCRGAEQGSEVSCYDCGDIKGIPEIPWNCTKSENQSLHTMTIECTIISVEDHCSTVSIDSGQTCMAVGILPIIFSPKIWYSGLAIPNETHSNFTQEDCSIIMSEAEYNRERVFRCHCVSDLCNRRLSITVLKPQPPPPTVPPLPTNDTASGNITETFEEAAALGPSESAAIALGIIVVLLSILLAALLSGLCYRLRQKKRLERRRIALMKSKFEPTPLHQ